MRGKRERNGLRKESSARRANRETGNEKSIGERERLNEEHWKRETARCTSRLPAKERETGRDEDTEVKQGIRDRRIQRITEINEESEVQGGVVRMKETEASEPRRERKGQKSRENDRDNQKE